MNLSQENSLPPKPPGAIEWLGKNLFNNWFNSILTIVSVAFVVFAFNLVFKWAVFYADWRPVTEFPLLYMIGQYPREFLWRIGLSLAIISLLTGISWGLWKGLIESFAITLGALLGLSAIMPIYLNDITIEIRIFMLFCVLLIFLGFLLGRTNRVTGKFTVLAWFISSLLIVLIILPGFSDGLLEAVPTGLWGGLLVTMILAIGGIVLSFPIGVLLALGRRSTLPVVKGFCIAFIELIRGVPLITILFMFSLILQVFLPVGSRFDRLLRALIGITIFSAAYMAENVRGGLQSIPIGQIEAAKAIGMNGVQINFYIVLPQALRIVIPAIVGQFISLFKDTTLVIILGINELLGIGRAVINSDPQFVQLQLEVYIFIALVFWVFSYAMSYSSLQLEKSLGVGER